MYFDHNFENEWLAHMQELHRQQNEDAMAPIFPFTAAPHPFNFAGIPRFYLLVPSGSMQRQLDPEHEEQILQNIKKIIEFMYSSVGLPEERSKRDAADQPTLSPEEAGIDMKRLGFAKWLVDHGIIGEFSPE